MGHPARAVAILANELGAAGDRLRAGDLITTGSLVNPVAMAAGDLFVASYGGLGRITLWTVA
jgi:2-keto-4-pentenoate hydratase